MITIWDYEFLSSVLGSWTQCGKYLSLIAGTQNSAGRQSVEIIHFFYLTLFIFQQSLLSLAFSKCFLYSYPKLWSTDIDSQLRKPIDVNRYDDKNIWINLYLLLWQFHVHSKLNYWVWIQMKFWNWLCTYWTWAMCINFQLLTRLVSSVGVCVFGKKWWMADLKYWS